MKKFLIFSLIFTLLVTFAPIKALAIESDQIWGKATYTETPPIIDGTVDEVWQTAEPYMTSEHYQEGQAYCAFKILWDEENLYFFAKVYDNSISCCAYDSSTNGVNFWVSETNSNLESFNERSGDRHIFCNQDANTGYFTGNMDAQRKVTLATQIYDSYYIVECTMPILTEGLTLEAGHIIGFDVSVDDDFDGDNIRDTYATWAHLGRYWECTKDLANVELIKLYEDTEEIPDSATAPVESEGSFETINPTQQMEPLVSDDDKGNVSNKLAVILTGAILFIVVVIAALSFLCRRKKKRV